MLIHVNQSGPRWKAELIKQDMNVITQQKHDLSQPIPELLYLY